MTAMSWRPLTEVVREVGAAGAPEHFCALCPNRLDRSPMVTQLGIHDATGAALCVFCFDAALDHALSFGPYWDADAILYRIYRWVYVMAGLPS